MNTIHENMPVYGMPVLEGPVGKPQKATMEEILREAGMDPKDFPPL